MRLGGDERYVLYFAHVCVFDEHAAATGMCMRLFVCVVSDQVCFSQWQKIEDVSGPCQCLSSAYSLSHCFWKWKWYRKQLHYPSAILNIRANHTHIMIQWCFQLSLLFCLVALRLQEIHSHLPCEVNNWLSSGTALKGISAYSYTWAFTHRCTNCE